MLPAVGAAATAAEAAEAAAVCPSERYVPWFGAYVYLANGMAAVKIRENHDLQFSK